MKVKMLYLLETFKTDSFVMVRLLYIVLRLANGISNHDHTTTLVFEDELCCIVSISGIHWTTRKIYQNGWLQWSETNGSPNDLTTYAPCISTRVVFRKYALTVCLIEDAVPSVFAFPEHLQQKKTTRRILIRTVADVNCEKPASSASSSICGASEVPPSMVQQHHNYALMLGPQGIKQKCEEQQMRDKKRRMMMAKKIKTETWTVSFQVLPLVYGWCHSRA